MAEKLLSDDPGAPEGRIAPRFNALVRRETCADVARQLGLGAMLRLGRSEARSGGRRKEALLADAMEAVIAAVYRDGGFEAARRVVVRLWGDRIGRVEADARDAKTALQEWAQARGDEPPCYVEIGREGPDHAPLFTIEARPRRRAIGPRQGRQQARGRAGRGRNPAGRRGGGGGGWLRGRARGGGAGPRTRRVGATGRPAARRSRRAREIRRAAPTPRRAGHRTQTRAGFAALIGEPNAGKSTLLNRMVGAKVSIVTHKVQTTRARVRGVAVEGAAQVVFVDTPGLFAPRRGLDRAMVAAAWGGAADADVVVLLIEAHRGLTDGVRAILDGLRGRLGLGGGAGPPVALAVNKIDRVRRDVLLGLTAEMADAFPFERVFLISAEKGDGVDDLRAWLAGAMPEGPWLYPEDQIADLPLRVLAAETTREKLTLRLHQELPYQLTVETDGWEERRDGSVRIDQVIYVAREGHRGIVLGRGGRDGEGRGEPRPRRSGAVPGAARPPLPARPGPAPLARGARAPRGHGARPERRPWRLRAGRA